MINQKSFIPSEEFLKQLAGEGSGEVVFATLNVIDKDGDVTIPGAFGRQTAFMIPAHQWTATGPPIGKVAIFERDNEAIARFKLNLETQNGREWRAHLKFDLEEGTPKQEWSYGFDILDAEPGERDGRTVRVLKSLQVHEVSPVIVGAGVNTRTVDVKGMKLADHFKTVEESLDDSRKLIERISSLAEMRSKEGRVLSRANRERLSRLATLLNDVRGDIEKLLDETGNDGKAAVLFAQFSEISRRIEKF